MYTEANKYMRMHTNCFTADCCYKKGLQGMVGMCVQESVFLQKFLQTILL